MVKFIITTYREKSRFRPCIEKDFFFDNLRDATKYWNSLRQKGEHDDLRAILASVETGSESPSIIASWQWQEFSKPNDRKPDSFRESLSLEGLKFLSLSH